jgi:cytosine/adenosine deaminase-related metal-dependent hydrolase
MAIRIRQSGGLTIALCAVEADEMPGDVYLDDAQHYALAAKFAHDWQGQQIDWQYPEQWAEMEKHKIRDAEEELNRWLKERAD